MAGVSNKSNRAVAQNINLRYSGAMKLNALGKRIRAWREFFGWSQAGLAEEAKVDRLTVVAVEGGGAWRSTTMQKLCDALGKAPDELMRLTPREERSDG